MHLWDFRKAGIHIWDFLTLLIEIAAFSECRICLHPHVSQIEHFSNRAFLKSSISQIEHFSNMEQFSNGAFWGRHHQLDDSLVGQLTTYFVLWPTKNNVNKVPRWVFRYVGNKTFDFSSKKKGFFAPKRPNLAQNWHFWSIWARPCRLLRCPVSGSVGGCGARAVSRKTPIYFIYIIYIEVYFEITSKSKALLEERKNLTNAKPASL